jgi:hypothetical protein
MPDVTLPEDSSTQQVRKALTDEERKDAAWTWSFSKYAKYKECTERYRLRYVEGIKIPGQSERPFFQGRVAHKIIEQTHARITTGDATEWSVAVQDMDALFDTYAEAVEWQDDRDKAQARVEAHEILANYLMLMEKHGLDAGETFCEHWFGTYQSPLILPNGLRLVGAIDWLKIDREKNEARIFDAKTSQGTRYLDRDQLVLYSAAVKHAFGVDIAEIGYLMLRWNRSLVYNVTQAEIDTLLSNMCDASRKVESGVLSASPNMQLCGTCEYSSSNCNPFRHWIMDGGTRQEAEW